MALVTALVAGLLVVGGCGDDDVGGAAGDAGAEAEAADPGAVGGDDGSTEGSEQNRVGSNLLQEQQLIQTAQLTVEVGDVLAAVREAERMANGAGGRVDGEQVGRNDGDGIRDANLTLRVPGDAYESTLIQLAGLGNLLEQTREARDVTREVVDLESRIATQRESIDRVGAILADATRLADVMTIEGELTRRQADLESMLAQQQALSEQVDLTTIRATFVAPGEEPATAKFGFISGLMGGWAALVTVVVVLLTVLGALLPFAIIVGIVAWVVLGVRRLVRRGQPAPAVAAPGAPPPGDPGR